MCDRTKAESKFAPFVDALRAAGALVS